MFIYNKYKICVGERVVRNMDKFSGWLLLMDQMNIFRKHICYNYIYKYTYCIR